VTGSLAQAQAMAELGLPAGTEPADLRVLPALMRAKAPGGTGWAGASRILIVPGQPLGSPAPLSAGGWMSCPPPVVTYALRFTARDKQDPAVTTSAGCGTIAISVNGKPQPSLWDTKAGLEAIASALLVRS
jgi:hypothetical protein